MNESKKYAPGYLEIERIQKEAQRIGEAIGEKIGIKKGKKEKAVEMAKTSLEEGLSIELIMKLTGLTKDEIEKL